MLKSNDREIAIIREGYLLSRITEADRDLYVELQRQTIGESSLHLNPRAKDVMWRSTLESQWLYGIFDEFMNFIGTVELADDSRTPEIGIAIMEKYRNKGVARNAIKMLIEITYKPESIDYYLVRIKSGNNHSKHVFEKMGAEYIGEELSELVKFQEFLRSQNWDKKLGDELSGIFKERQGEETVAKYKLDPAKVLFE